MKFSEAVKALEEGKYVMSDSFEDGQYIHLSDKELIDETGRNYSFYVGCINENWELYDTKLINQCEFLDHIYEYFQLSDINTVYKIFKVLMLKYYKEDPVNALRLLEETE